ncbi:hypothetical protein DYB34_000033 [Aphanomyces astaci]|uniref:Anoctamin transmembrane domain-containing protein n=1 Tax=Aphanomyces astaci TaxID=112090 RepID=A0A3R6ZIA9_APHAT|nr:hypothetical protein DYB34_000033 [Aphanomyces astaci]
MQIGALSKVEAEFDFAIILKPSRSDEQAVVGNTDRHRPSVAPPLTTNLKGFYKKNPLQGTTELLRRLHNAGLETKRIRSLDGKQLLVKVKAPQAVLEFGAEQMKLKKQRRGDLMWIEFSSSLRATFVDFDATDDSCGVMQFLDKDKQSIVYHLLTSDDGGAGLNDHNDLFVAMVEHMMPLHKANLEHLRHSWVYYWRPPRGVASSACWVSRQVSCLGRLFGDCLTQPLDDVATYFGEKVAFYFAWVEMYTKWLVAPVVVGIFLFVQQVQSASLDQPLAPVYALFMAIWASLFLVAWRRRANSLAYRWGVLGYEEDDEVLRPAFRTSATSGLTWKRWLKYTVTWSIVVGCIALVLTIMFAAFTARDRLEDESVSIQNNVTATLQDHELTLSTLSSIHDVLTPRFWFYCLVMPMLYGLCIPVFDIAFTWVATTMTTWENHATESAHQSALILKVFPFRCIHVFATLYYYAFAAQNNLLRVAIQLATFMLSGQMWNNVVKTGLPLLRRRYQLHRKRQATSKLLETDVRHLGGGGAAGGGKGLSSVTARANHQCLRLEHATSEVWDECNMYPYDAFEDYTEMLIQFGYVSFFSIAFPLAPLLAFVNNVVSLRVDAFKLCHTTQRPRADKASGIGIWFPVLQMMSVVAVITNCLHVAFTTTQIEQYVPAISPSTKVWVVFVAEHVVVAMQLWIAFVVPAMTPDIAAKARLERAFAKRATASLVTSFHRSSCHELDASDVELVI